MAESKTVKLTHPNGVTVRVASDKVERLEGQGFTRPKSSSSSKQ